jgi:hypothetical protein
MAFIVKEQTKVAVMEEATEGVYEEAADAESFIQPIDGYSISPAKETKERNILTSGYGMARARVGQKSVGVSVSTEMRGSGLEGEQNDYHSLLKATLGGNRELAARTTSFINHSTTEIFLSAAEALKYDVGDIVCVLEAGAHHISPVIEVVDSGGGEKIVLLVPMASAPVDAVEIAKFQTYFPSNTLSDYPTLSIAFYHGNEIRESGHGLRPASMALSNFVTGEIAQFDFSLEGISFDEVDEPSPYEPNFDDAAPPLILSSCVFQDGAQIDLNEFSFAIENKIGFIKSTCSEDGRISSRFSGKRSVKGKINPYKDSASIANFTKFTNNTPFSLFSFSANPSSVSGEYELGSIVAFYLPECISNSKQVSDDEGVLIEDIEFTSDAGDAGEGTEIYIGLI